MIIVASGFLKPCITAITDVCVSGRVHVQGGLSLLCGCTSKIIFGNAFMQTPFKSTVHLEPNKISLFLNFGSPSVSFFFITRGQILSHELRENLTLK